MNRKFLLLIFLCFSSFVAANAQEQSAARTELLKAQPYLYSNPDSAKYHIDRGFAIATNANDSILAYKLFGVYSDVSGYYADALNYFTRVYELATRINDTLSVGNSLMNIGNMHQTLRNAEAALEYYLMAEQKFKLINNIRQNLALRTNMGGLYVKMRLVPEAILQYREAYELAKNAGDERGMSIAAGNLSGTLILEGYHDEGFKYLLLADSMHKELDEQFGMSSIYQNFALYYKEIGDYKKQEEYLLLFAENCLMFNQREKLLKSYSELSQLYSKQNNLKRALEFGLKSEQLALEFKSHEDKVAIYDHIAGMYGDLGYKEKQIEYLQKTVKAFEWKEEEVIKDKLISFRAKEDIDNTRRKLLESEQNQAKLQQVSIAQRNFILALSVILVILFVFIYLINRSKNISRKLAVQLDSNNKILEESVSYQKHMLSILAHDFKSPLASTYGLLELMEQETLSQDEFRQFLAEIKDKIRHTLLNVDEVYLWVQAQNPSNKPNLQSVSLLQAVKEVSNFVSLQASEKLMEIRSKDVVEDVVIADANHLNIILRNIVSNAIKFSQIGDVIEIGSTKTDTHTKLVIQDHGVGMSESDLIALKNKQKSSAVGTSGETGTGMGMRLILDYAALNKIEVEVESKLGQGTTFILSFLNK